MKRISILIIVFISALAAYSQNYLQDGDRCFDSSDYACAILNYNNAFKTTTGKDKQVAEIKLTRAKWCSEHISTANQVYNNRNYSLAKDEYQKVLDSNPKDSYAQSQIAKCDNALNPPKLRKATTAELTDIWNNKYGILTTRRQNLINAGIDPDDAQVRINAGEGKPKEKEKQATSLSVSKNTLSFASYGETSEQIKVYSDASTYSVPSGYLPSWCTVKTYSGYFTVTTSANPNYASRNDWFKVTAGGKEVRITVTQAGKTSYETPKQETTLNVSEESIYFSASGGTSKKIKIYSNAGTYSVSKVPTWCNVQTNNGYIVVTCNKNYSKTYRQDYFTVVAGDKSKCIYVTQGGKNDCFNCPKTHDTWGITAGYLQKSIDYTEGVQLGLRIEPLFKSGFGINTGINFEGYSTDLSSALNGDEEFEQYALNIPLHLEYRLNFSKWFNIFAYGGAGLNVVTNSLFDDYSLPTTFEYGGGLRINHIQFNIGRSLYLGNLRNTQEFGTYTKPYQNLILSVSYMF